MDPQFFALSIVALIAVVLGLAIWILKIGMRYQQPKVDYERDRADRAEGREQETRDKIEAERAQADALSGGAREDADRRADLAGAGDDFERVLDTRFGEEKDPVPGEQGDQNDEIGT